MEQQADLQKLRIERDIKPGAQPRRRRWRKRIVLLLLAGAAGVLWLRYGDRLKGPPEVEITTVTLAYPSQEITAFNATGYVVPQTKADIASKATGRLEALEVEEGERVRAGDVVARLESQDMVAARDRTRAQLEAARAEVAQARARLLQAEAAVAEARAELNDAERALARARAVVEQNYITREAYDAAVWRHEKAQATLRSAEAGVAAAKAGITAAEAQVGAAEAAYHEAEIAVEYTLIRAPFNGVILSQFADVGDVVAPFASTTQSKGAVVSMADMSTLQVEADVSESNLVGVTLGQPCEIQLDALPGVRLRGRVESIVPTVDRSKATVLVKVAFVDRDERVLPDMSAKVGFLTRELEPDEREPVLAIKPEAIMQRDGTEVAFRVENGIARAVPVERRGKLGELVVVGEPFASGDRLVLKPGEDIRDGLAVIVPEE